MMKIFALRLKPNQDLKSELKKFTSENKVQAGFILTTVGSLKKAQLRLANQKQSTSFVENFEIISLVGTLCQDGVHLHIALADSKGHTIGGHLEEGCVVYTTAEIMLGESNMHRFTRVFDPETGFHELEIL
jgi:predicted DNA-binding protein with PD1-like motif